VALHTVHSYTQTIYLASELGHEDGGFIKEIHYHFNAATAIHNERYQVWIMHTTQSDFAYTGSVGVNVIDIATAELVFDGDPLLLLTAIPGQENWVRIVLDEPFIFNGEDNIMITVEREGLAMPPANRFYEDRTGFSDRSLAGLDALATSLPPLDKIPDTRLLFVKYQK
jgi:hypothetical protein